MRQFTFMWFIENYSYCWPDAEKGICSPEFLVEILHSTSWYLQLYPKGSMDQNSIYLELCRCECCNGPENISLHCELSFLAANGKDLKSAEIKEDCQFEKGMVYGFCEELCGLEYHQDDTDVVTVRFKMWAGEGKVDKEDIIYARTRLGLEKISFITIIENFGTLKPNSKKSFDVTTVSKTKLKLSGNVYVKREAESGETDMVEIFPDSENGHLITCQIYLFGSAGKEVKCGEIDTRNYIHRVETFRFPIKFGNNLLDKKLEFLDNDNLKLRFECTFATEIDFKKIEETVYDFHLTPFLGEKRHDSNFVSCPREANSVSEDFRNLYKDPILSDFQLKTVNKVFPVHKCVLCARSPVLKAMLTTDMKERNMNCIQVDDLDDGTIDQFLHFLYTDVLKDLQWESAMKLYYAADKYQVQYLKYVCSSFFITKINTINFIDLLILADRHQDSSLKVEVQNFICKSKKKIFVTEEWENFMKTHGELASNTMHFYLKHIND